MDDNFYLTEMQNLSGRLKLQRLIIEQNDLKRALWFLKRHPLDDGAKGFLKEKGSKEMKWLFSLPFGSVKIASEDDAILALNGERTGFKCCRVTIINETGESEEVGWLSQDESQSLVFLSLSGFLTRESGVVGIMKPRPFIK